MSIPWLKDEVGLFAGASERGLSWLALASPSEEGDDEVYRFIASTANVDRMGDVIEQDSWQLEAWKSNPVILYEHKHPVVGVGVDIAKGSDLKVAIRFDDHPVNPTGQLAAHQHRTGIRRALSVGFIPHESVSRKDLPEGHPARVADPNVPKWAAGYVFRGSELLEISTVSVPANRDALQLSALSKLFTGQEFAERFMRGAGERTAELGRADALRLIRTDAEIQRAIRAVFPAERPTPTTPERSSLDHIWSK